MTPPTFLLLAMIAVESNWIEGAQGARGELGLLQIRPEVIEDVNRIQKNYYFTAAEARTLNGSLWIAEIYLDHYATRKRLGRQPQLEDMARIWNGGPNGSKRKATLPYWKKVKTVIISKHD